MAPLTAPLLARLEARVREKAAPSTPAVCFFTATVEREMRELLEAAGYDHVRTFFRMRIDLVPEKMVKPALPTNVEIRPLRVGQDERELHAVIEESFAQHFRHTERSFEDWWAARGRHEKFDPALFLLAWDGDRVAGGIVAYDFGDIGFVRELGVRSAWRGRNLGLALLLRSFESFLAKGQRRVALGVDAENENALGLYLRAGMWEDSRHLVLRRMLAP
ncbi:MAG TPA: GNAT family N-acetyltransferase [Candidatus Polarisedimenticolia bacterium]|nr:GNAT family N-acetyltransferase [Candidatus Polarisedimenticolia bacterium]